MAKAGGGGRRVRRIRGVRVWAGVLVGLWVWVVVVEGGGRWRRRVGLGREAGRMS